MKVVILCIETQVHSLHVHNSCPVMQGEPPRSGRMTNWNCTCSSTPAAPQTCSFVTQTTAACSCNCLFKLRLLIIFCKYFSRALDRNKSHKNTSHQSDSDQRIGGRRHRRNTPYGCQVYTHASFTKAVALEIETSEQTRCGVFYQTTKAVSYSIPNIFLV